MRHRARSPSMARAPPPRPPSMRRGLSEQARRRLSPLPRLSGRQRSGTFRGRPPCSTKCRTPPSCPPPKRCRARGFGGSRQGASWHLGRWRVRDAAERQAAAGFPPGTARQGIRGGLWNCAGRRQVLPRRSACRAIPAAVRRGKPPPACGGLLQILPATGPRTLPAAIPRVLPATSCASAFS